MADQECNETLVITIKHLDSNEKDFSSCQDREFPLNYWNAEWKKFSLSTVPETYLNKMMYQGIDFTRMDESIDEFLSFEKWKYKEIIIKHEFKTTA